MKSLTLLVAVALVSSAIAYPADPKDDVELVTPKNTNAESVDDDIDDVNTAQIPVIIIRARPFFGGRPSLFGPSNGFDRNLGFGGFPFGGFPFSVDGDDDIFGVDSDERRTSPESDAADDDDEEEASKIPCGFLCSILKGLEDHFKEVAGRRNETAKDDYDVYNETYTEKTLSDGTVVKINRTVIADTSDDGNSFFFHSTSFHHPGFGKDGKEYEDEEEEAIEHEFADKKEKKEETAVVDEDTVGLKTSTAATSTTDAAVTTGIIPSIDDEEEEFNDVLADVNKSKSNNNNGNKGVDDGLITAEGIQK